MRRLALLAALAAFSATAEVRSIPSEPWSALRLVRDAKRFCVVDAKGNDVLRFAPEPNGASLASVKASIEGDCLVVDAGAALADGLRKLQLLSSQLDRASLGGRDCSLVATIDGPVGSELDLYFEGHGPQPVGHFYRRAKVKPRGTTRDYPLVTDVPDGLNDLHVRLDVLKAPAGKPVRIHLFRSGTEKELPVQLRKRAVKPELLFKASFDGTADAEFATGEARPLNARALSYAQGVDGQAVRLSRKVGSHLRYAVKGNVDPVRGSVALWLKREWDFSAPRQPWRSIFAFPWPGNASFDRVGSGALWFWFHGTTLRADQSDAEDLYGTYDFPADGNWVHLVYEWDEEGVQIFVNGKPRHHRGDGFSPLADALRTSRLVQCDRREFRDFTLGSRGEADCIDALIDDFRIYSAPLGADAVRALWREHAPKEASAPSHPDYAKLFANDGPNAYEAPSVGNDGHPGRLELVERVTLDASGLARLRAAGRFNAVGEVSVRQLNGVPYLEMAKQAGSRAAFRFSVPTNAALCCFEFDYPDDACRTADLIVQPCRGGDYVMQVGYAAGDEYPNTGRILTHRCLYWTHAPEVAVVLMTARPDAPAALSAIRLSRVAANALPSARVNEPAPNPEGWRRSVALYFEDPAIGYDFGLSPESVATPKGLGELIDRTAAKMKYTGENLFAYPGAWYHGLIGESYNPRQHAPDFLRAWYVKFGKEGLGVIPTVNPNTMPVEDGLVTRASMGNGALHPSEIAIHDTGKPNWGKWHDTPPNFNFHHPKVRANIARIVDALVAQGKDYPAFKGVCMHMTRHCMLWFGDEISGYNDYTVKAFCSETGTNLPFEKFADKPLRGKDYAAWLRANCREAWLQWRCDQVTAFYVRLARRLAAVRPDLKLWLNSFAPADVTNPDFMRPDYMELANRRCGLDGPALTKGASNIILCQSLVPADYRWRHPENYPRPEVRDHQRVIDTLPGFYSLLKGADYPWVNQHDRYWESAIGRAGGSLTTSWMTECGWRVSTINPSGRNALRHFVQPLRHADVLGLSKGGFLIGTYGMEDVLVPFVRAFRALPAVVMKEVWRKGDVVVRQADFDGKSYFYVVNTGLNPQILTVDFPKGASDLVSGQSFEGTNRLNLDSYELRSFCALIGAPSFP